MSTRELREVVLRLGDEALVVDGIGGGIRAYSSADGEVLDGYARAGQADGGRGQVLAPWPNRLDAGTYIWGAETYMVPITEAERSTANHGLVRKAQWRLSEESATEALASFDLEPSRGYPFALRLAVRYRLSRQGLAVETEVRNVGNRPAPFGLGFHPYLTAGDARIDASRLEVHAGTVLDLDARGLPTGRRRSPSDVLGPTGAPVGGRVLDDCVGELERDDDGLAVVRLTSEEGDVVRTVWMDETFRYVMLFTGDTLAPERRRRSLAIEPMTCPPNAFATGDDLVRLEPGERRRFRWGIWARLEGA